MKCTRCSGLVVSDYFCGGETVFNAWAYEGGRCVNCGAIAGARPVAWPVGRRGERPHTMAYHGSERGLPRKLGA